MRGGSWTLLIVLCALIAAPACSRSLLPVGDTPSTADQPGPGGQASAAGAGSGDSRANGAAGAGDVSPSQDDGTATDSDRNANAGGAGDGADNGGSQDGTTTDANGNAGGRPRDGDAAPPPPGTPPPAAGAGSGDAASVLNPQRCATDHPFVLSIDPGGESGRVQGWLESAPSVAFDEHDLPRFGVQTSPEEVPAGELTLWWSISSFGDQGNTLWFYAATSATEVAYLPGVTRVSQIGDATKLKYVDWSVGPVSVGELVVFHHKTSDRYLAVRAIDMYGTEDSQRRELCSAIDARWVFAPQGGDFSGLR